MSLLTGHLFSTIFTSSLKNDMHVFLDSDPPDTCSSLYIFSKTPQPDGLGCI